MIVDTSINDGAGSILFFADDNDKTKVENAAATAENMGSDNDDDGSHSHTIETATITTPPSPTGDDSETSFGSMSRIRMMMINHSEGEDDDDSSTDSGYARFLNSLYDKARRASEEVDIDEQPFCIMSGDRQYDDFVEFLQQQDMTRPPGSDTDDGDGNDDDSHIRFKDFIAFLQGANTMVNEKSPRGSSNRHNQDDEEQHDLSASFLIALGQREINDVKDSDDIHHQFEDFVAFLQDVSTAESSSKLKDSDDSHHKFQDFVAFLQDVSTAESTNSKECNLDEDDGSVKDYADFKTFLFAAAPSSEKKTKQDTSCTKNGDDGSVKDYADFKTFLFKDEDDYDDSQCQYTDFLAFLQEALDNKTTRTNIDIEQINDDEESSTGSKDCNLDEDDNIGTDEFVNFLFGSSSGKEIEIGHEIVFSSINNDEAGGDDDSQCQYSKFEAFLHQNVKSIVELDGQQSNEDELRREGVVCQGDDNDTKYDEFVALLHSASLPSSLPLSTQNDNSRDDLNDVEHHATATFMAKDATSKSVFLGDAQDESGMGEIRSLGRKPVGLNDKSPEIEPKPTTDALQTSMPSAVVVKAKSRSVEHVSFQIDTSNSKSGSLEDAKHEYGRVTSRSSCSEQGPNKRTPEIDPKPDRPKSSAPTSKNFKTAKPRTMVKRVSFQITTTKKNNTSMTRRVLFVDDREESTPMAFMAIVVGATAGFIILRIAGISIGVCRGILIKTFVLLLSE